MRPVMHLPPPPFCRREALRYAGCRQENAEVAALLESAWQEAEGQLTYQICFREFPLQLEGEHCWMQFAGVQSRALARHLRGCESILLLGATVGPRLDRLILKYGKIAPARGLMMQAIGAERIEALCDDFCRQLQEQWAGTGRYITTRFSPGYGDLPLELQRDIFRALGPEKAIGLTLNDSLLMSPSKSVTAIMGVTRERRPMALHACGECSQENCAYRRKP